MSEKTILLPYWTSWHGNYVFAAALLSLIAITFLFFAKRSAVSLPGCVLLFAMFNSVPDSHEPLSSNVSGIIAQLVLITTFVYSSVTILYYSVHREVLKKEKQDKARKWVLSLLAAFLAATIATFLFMRSSIKTPLGPGNVEPNSGCKIASDGRGALCN